MSTTVVFYDPGAISKAVWFGSAITAVSVVFIALSIYGSIVRPIKFFKIPFAILLLWLILFIAQVGYIATYPVIIYAVVYNATSNSFVTYTARNPVLPGVVAVTIITALTAIIVIIFQTVYGGAKKYLEVWR